MHYFHTKLLYQKPILRHIEWRVQNRLITKNGVLPVTTLVFWKFCFSLRTFYKELIWCTNDPNAHIHTFCNHWSFIWRRFFPVSILNSQLLLSYSITVNSFKMLQKIFQVFPLFWMTNSCHVSLKCWIMMDNGEIKKIWMNFGALTR